MYYFAYSYARNYGILPLRETALDSGFKPQPKLDHWSDEQLAQIRLVLQRLTSLRIQNAEDVEDLVQETLLTMTMKCSQYKLEKGLLIWSMGILRKKIGNYYRKAHRCASNGQEASSDPATPWVAAQQSPEAGVQYAELRALIDHILAELTPNEQKAMNMLLAGMAPSLIVESLHPERYQTVITRLYRGRQKLQRELLKHGYGPPK